MRQQLQRITRGQYRVTDFTMSAFDQPSEAVLRGGRGRRCKACPVWIRSRSWFEVSPTLRKLTFPMAPGRPIRRSGLPVRLRLCFHPMPL